MYVCVSVENTLELTINIDGVKYYFNNFVTYLANSTSAKNIVQLT